MDQLVLSDLSHKVLQEVITTVTNLNPVLIEFMELIELLVTDHMSRPNLAFIDTFCNNASEFKLKDGLVVFRLSYGGACIFPFSGESDIVIVNLHHVLGVFRELLGLKNVLSKLSWSVSKPGEAAGSCREFLFLATSEYAICWPGVRIIHFVFSIVVLS